MNGAAREALRQQMLLRALLGDARPGVVAGWLRDGPRVDAGLAAYRANAGALAERALAAAYPTVQQLLGEVSFWNVFGFDRGAVLNYFVLPVKFSRVLIAKNITAAVFVFLEIGAITLVCFALRMPVTLVKVVECYAVTAVMTLQLLAIGNLGSVYYPRPINPGHSWRSASAGRFQAFLMLL